MTTEWRDVTDPEKLFRLKKMEWDIELFHGVAVWIKWDEKSWSGAGSAVAGCAIRRATD